MKKRLILAGLLSCIFMQAVSAEELWCGPGAGFGNVFAFSDDVDTTYLGALGGEVSMYFFPNQKPVGMFMRASFLHPLISSGPDGADSYDGVTSVSVGMTGRLAIPGAFAFYGGVGMDGLFLGNSYYRQDADSEEDYQKTVGAIGVGGHIGFKWDITDFMYADIGCTLSWLFYNRTSIRSYTKENGAANYVRQEENVKGYSLLSVRPYIGIGFNCYSEGKTTWGKPAR